jgi:ribosome production factor 2
MVKLQRVQRPKTQRGKRALKEREPKLLENARSLLCIRGNKTNNIMKILLKNLHLLKAPYSSMYQRKNLDIYPFDNTSKLEWYCQKSNCSLFAYITNSKKRPNNLVLARLHNHLVLDMFELELNGSSFRSLDDFKGTKFAPGNKPCLIFHGELFDTEAEYKRLKCFFIDFFRGEINMKEIDLSGLEHVMTFTLDIQTKLLSIRVFRIELKKSGHRIPRIELNEIGPRMDLIIRRTKLASDDFYKKTLKQPDAIKQKKVKNVTTNELGTKLGRIHMEKQDFSQLQTRKMKGLKRNLPVDTESSTPGKKKKTIDQTN